ncbi:hypothetical protein EVAR_61514_1 [Eumeta japonica]|uniref:Uncharacterized protein n=1 Tax=Eumeta variegata TaxID=151549 RepID=A0A4C2A222_EUMVA|nr:hypothetical protein EVAR_61514_1 [Eumeta japonica]
MTEEGNGNGTMETEEKGREGEIDEMQQRKYEGPYPKILEALPPRKPLSSFGMEKQYQLINYSGLNQMTECNKSLFNHFQSCNFDVKNEPRSGQSVTDKIDAILKKEEQHRRTSSYNIPEELGIDRCRVRLGSQPTIHQLVRHLRRDRYQLAVIVSNSSRP